MILTFNTAVTTCLCTQLHHSLIVTRVMLAESCFFPGFTMRPFVSTCLIKQDKCFTLLIIEGGYFFLTKGSVFIEYENTHESANCQIWMNIIQFETLFHIQYFIQFEIRGMCVLNLAYPCRVPN